MNDTFHQINHPLCRTRLATANAAASMAAAITTATNTSMELDLPVDPNEPTYCFCNQVSYGEMVACDNPDVCYNPITSYYIFLSISAIIREGWQGQLILIFLSIVLTKSSFLFAVQNRMVSLWVCWP